MPNSSGVLLSVGGRCATASLGAFSLYGVVVELSIESRGDTLFVITNDNITVSPTYTWYLDSAVVGTGLYYIPTANGTYELTGSCSSLASINYIRTGVNDIDRLQMGVYPNPVKRGNILHTPYGEDVKVYNHIGALVHEAQRTAQINTAALAAGIYILMVDGKAAKLLVE